MTPEPSGPNRTAFTAVPPRQCPYEQALQRGFDALASRPPTPERLAALGGIRAGGAIRLPALNRNLIVDLEQRRVQVEGTGPARSAWAVLAVHYLDADNLEPDSRVVSFSYFSDCRSYLSVFGKRITERFLHGAGRSAEHFERLAAESGGTRVPDFKTAFRFDVFPRIPLTIVRYEGDEEIRAGASVIYRADAEQLLPAEDRVVAAELLLDQLAGKSLNENGGNHA